MAHHKTYYNTLQKCINTKLSVHLRQQIEQPDEWDGEDAGEDGWGIGPPRWKRQRAVKWTLNYAGDT